MSELSDQQLRSAERTAGRSARSDEPKPRLTGSVRLMRANVAEIA
jgi:hypothetical protein